MNHQLNYIFYDSIVVNVTIKPRNASKPNDIIPKLKPKPNHNTSLIHILMMYLHTFDCNCYNLYLIKFNNKTKISKKNKVKKHRGTSSLNVRNHDDHASSLDFPENMQQLVEVKRLGCLRPEIVW